MVKGFWFNGRWYLYIAGGSGEGESGGEGGDGSGDQSKDSSGASGQQSGASGAEGDSKSDGDGEGKDKQGQIQKALDQARAAQRKAEARVAEYEKKERETAEAEALKRGEHEKVIAQQKEQHAKELAERDAKIFSHSVNEALADYLNANHAGYLGRTKWMRPLVSAQVTPDMDETAINKAIKAVVDDYVKDHPLPSEGGAPGGAGGKSGKTGENPDPLANFPGIKEFAEIRKA